jgi:hypothetical protein
VRCQPLWLSHIWAKPVEVSLTQGHRSDGARTATTGRRVSGEAARMSYEDADAMIK